MGVEARPFQQIPFEDVPDQPRVPHRWAETKREDVAITTPALGTTRLAVRTFGSGPPLVLVHGLMTAGYSFRYLLDLMGQHFSLVIPDLPGAGHSDYPDVYLGPDVLAGSMIALVDALGIRGAPVIGNSMGGYVCMRAALIDPAAFSRLVNLHSPGVATARMHALRWAMKILPSRAIVSWLVRRDPERWVHKQVHYYDETLKSREEHREFSTPLKDPAGLRGFYHHLRDGLDSREMAKFVAQLRTRTFPIPVQLIYAERDPVVPPVVGQKLRALIPAAEFVELKDASHFAHVDAAQRFVDAALPFLLRH